MASREKLYPVPSISNINPSFKVAVFPKSRSRAEKSALCGDEVSVSDSHRRRALEQKKRKPHRASVPSASERRPRHDKSKVDDGNPEVKPESVLEPEAGEPDRILPLRPASPLSRPTTNRRESFETLRLARYGGGPRNDPFSVYPIPADGFVPRAADVCKISPVSGMLYESSAELTRIASSPPGMGPAADPTSPEIDGR
jgi:hypothetical protein